MRVLYLSLLLVISDQVSKLVVKGFSIPFLGIEFEGMRYAESIKVIGDFFKITFVENPGMAFGIDVSDGSKLFLSLFSLVASIGILIYLYKLRNEKLIIRISLALIFAGAVGNLIDRTFYGLFYGYAPIFYGKVVDFFNVDFWDFTIFGRTYERWPIFNIADASVTVGVLLLIIFHREPISSENKDDEDLQEVNSVPADSSDELPGGETIDDKETDTASELKLSDEDGEDNNRKDL